jgi:hypothetical protein
MQHTGFSLIDSNNNIVESWHENNGSRSAPDVIFIPDSDVTVHAPDLYTDYNGYKLVKRHLVDDKPSEWYQRISSNTEFNGTDVVETFVYPEDPNIVPQSVTPVQFRKALNQLNIRNEVDNYVSTLDQDSKDAWEYATSFDRGNPILAAAAVALNKTTKEVDDLFRLASTL